MFQAAELSFSEIHGFFKKVIDEVETRGEADLKALSGEVQTAIANEKAEILKEVATSSPDIQAAVQKGIDLLEQAVLGAITAHLA